MTRKASHISSLLHRLWSYDLMVG